MLDMGTLFMTSFQNAQQIAQTTGMIKAFDSSSLGEQSKVAAKTANAEYLAQVEPIIAKQRESVEAAKLAIEQDIAAQRNSTWSEKIFEAEQERLLRLLQS